MTAAQMTVPFLYEADSRREFYWLVTGRGRSHVANPAAIQAVTEAILRGLKDAARPTGWPDVKIVAIRGQDYAAPPSELPTDALGVSVYLWRIDRNASMRNRRNPPAPDGSRRKPPVAVDLLYLVSAWGKAALDQHLVIGWALRALADLGSLQRGLLNSGAMGAVFAPGEAIELDWSPLPLDFASPLSDVLKHTWPPTVVLAARGVSIDSLVFEFPDGPPVQQRGLAALAWSGEEEEKF